MPFSEKLVLSAAKTLNVKIADILAIAEVESKGDGFLNTGEPKILYEPYKFGTHTNHKYNGTTVSIGEIDYPLSLKGAWDRNKARYGPTSVQYEKLKAASKLDKVAAQMSCSWGKFQIMGEHWKSLGYPSLQDFINRMYKSEDEHLDAFIRFIKVNSLADDLKDHRDSFFDRYNGPGWKENNYKNKFLAAFKRYSIKPVFS